MNLVSFVTFLSFFLYVLLGIHGFKTNPRARLNRFFLMLCIACAWWAFCIAMMFIAPDHGSAWFWFRLSSPGWAIGPAIILHFSMALTDQEKLLGRWTSALLVYTPGAVITFRGITVGVTASDVVLRGFGWSPVNEGGSIWYWVYTLYYLLCLGSCLYLLWRWGKTTSLVRQKKQSRILLVCTFMGTFLAFINESLLPALGYDTVPKLPVVLFLFWALGMWYTIDKYRLMVLSPDIAIDAILAGINDLFLMLDPRERIIKVNRPVRIILGYLENELFNQPLARIMNDNLWVRDVLNHIDQQNGSIECEVDFKDKNGNLIPVKINCSPLRDRFTDLVGIVIVGSDLRPTRLLEDQNAELEAMQYDLTESNNVLALKNQQLRNFLNNTGQGFLYFAQDLLICEDYSLECVKILGCDPEGQTLASLVYKDQGDDQEIMNQVFRLALDEQNQDRVEVYLSLLPEEFIINDRCISAVYKVVNRVQEERCVLAILTDISEKRLLEQQMQEEKNIQNMLVRSIINYEEFMDCVLDYQNYCLYGINYLTGGDDEVDTLIVDTMRTIHTYKGIFSQFGTIHVVQQLHELEMTLSEKRADNGLTGDDFIEYMRQLHMEQWLEEDLALIKSMLGDQFISKRNTVNIEKDKLMALEEKMAATLAPQDYRILLPEVRRLRFRPLQEMLKPYAGYVDKLASKMGKLINPLIIEGDYLLVDTDYYHNFTKSLIHVFRNAVDHGIETMEERVQKGKPEAGTISCHIKDEANRFILTIADDGAGIDFAALREKAAEAEIGSTAGTGALSESALLELIFREEISTREHTTLISGRGMGLSAVKAEVERINGHVGVNPRGENGFKLVFQIPIPAMSVIPHSEEEIILDSLAETAEDFLKRGVGVLMHKRYADSCKEEIPGLPLNVFVPLAPEKEAVLTGGIFLSFNEDLAGKLMELFIFAQIMESGQTFSLDDVVTECANIMVGNSLRRLEKRDGSMLMGAPVVLGGSEVLGTVNLSALYCIMESNQYCLTIGIIEDYHMVS